MSWKDHRVVTFNGSRSTRKGTSEEFLVSLPSVTA